MPAARPLVFTNAYAAPVADGSAGVAAVTGVILSAVRVESGSSVVKAVVAPASVLATDTRSWSGMSMVCTRLVSVSRTASIANVVTRPVTLRLASSSTPGSASKASWYDARPPLTVGGADRCAVRATPSMVTVEIASGWPPRAWPEALSTYLITRGKSAPTVTVKSFDRSVRSPAACAPAGTLSTPAASATVSTPHPTERFMREKVRT